jgi:hypothetical protein
VVTTGLRGRGQADLWGALLVSATAGWTMLWDTFWQFLPLIVLAVSAAAWMVRDVVRSATPGTSHRVKSR